MKHSFRILVINPDSNATRIGVFENEVCILTKTIQHHQEQLNEYPRMIDQYQLRAEAILTQLNDEGINISKFSAICGRGGLLHPIEGGTYLINADMLHDLRDNTYGEHASNLGAWIADKIARGLNISSFIVDPVVVDELLEIARISGLPQIPRRSVFHALSHKAAARKCAEELNRTYQDVNLIVAHIGNGITIGAHHFGKVIDVNNGLHGDGPFSSVRAGTIPAGDLAAFCLSGTYSWETITNMLIDKGGFKGYLKTRDVNEVERRIQNGDQQANLIYQAMCYQIAKEIGAMATVLNGAVDAIVLTGFLTKQKRLVDDVLRRVNWIADLFVYPDDNELRALNEGTLRVLRGEEMVKHYVSNLTDRGD